MIRLNDLEIGLPTNFAVNHNRLSARVAMEISAATFSVCLSGVCR